MKNTLIDQDQSFYQHGGNVFEIAQKLDVSLEEITDLSSNVAHVIPKSIKKYLQSHIEGISRLPEPYSNSASLQIADYYGIQSSQLILGAGTTELIQWLCYFYASQKVFIVQPTYSDYEKYASLHGHQIIHHVLRMDDGFHFNRDRFYKEMPHPDMVFICNPNNPTGKLIDQDILLSIIHKFSRTLFVIDESYMPFVKSELSFSLHGKSISNLVVLRSMSKIYGIPGLRLGWLYSSNESLIEKIKNAISPWSVNSLAQMIVPKLLEYNTDELRLEIQKTKERFLQSISDLSWLIPYPTLTNYVLIRSVKYSSTELFEYCYKAQILIRNCDNFRGLDPSFIRISFKDSISTQKVVGVLKSID